MSIDPRAVGAILTALLHLLMLVALVQVTVSVVQPPQPSAQAETTADALYGAGEQVVDVDISPGLSTAGMPCEGSSYIGVGVTAEPGTERIILVGDNTPASRSGLRHNDIVLNPDVWRDAHREGALLRLLVLRDGVRLEVTVLVGKICIG